MASVRLKPRAAYESKSSLPPTLTPRRSARAETALTPMNSRTRTPQSSCSEMRLLYAAFNSLSESYKWYDSIIPSRLTNEAFPVLFSRFSDAFDGFTRLAARALGSVNPSHVVPYQATSSLALAARTLALAWVACLSGITSISEKGTAPLFQRIASHFHAILQILQLVGRAFKSERFRTDVGGNALEELVAAVQRVQRDVEVNVDIDSEIREITNLTRVLFDRALPLYFRQASELSWYRTQIIGKCAEIREFAAAVIEFEPIVGRLKSEAVAFNRELTGIQTILNLPFAIEVTVEVRKPPA
jgi:hypothetical protein